MFYYEFSNETQFESAIDSRRAKLSSYSLLVGEQSIALLLLAELDCSPTLRVSELGLTRRETKLFYPTVLVHISHSMKFVFYFDF